MTVRLLTWNVWWRFGPWEQRQAAIEATLRKENPDIICLQEVWASDGGEDQAATLAAALGYEYGRTPSPFWEGYSFGNAILSRWPILAAQTHRLPDEHGRATHRAALEDRHRHQQRRTALMGLHQGYATAHLGCVRNVSWVSSAPGRNR